MLTRTKTALEAAREQALEARVAAEGVLRKEARTRKERGLERLKRAEECRADEHDGQLCRYATDAYDDARGDFELALGIDAAYARIDRARTMCAEAAAYDDRLEAQGIGIEPAAEAQYALARELHRAADERARAFMVFLFQTIGEIDAEAQVSIDLFLKSAACFAQGDALQG